MTSKTTITSVQLLMMSVGSALMFSYTFMPILDTPPANQDVWIVLIISAFYTTILSIPALILANRFRGLSVNEMTELILGKFLGKVASFLFFALFLFCFAACMSIAAIFASIAIFPETPIWAFLLYAIVPISYASYKGVGTIGRLATFIVPFVMLTIIIFFLMGTDMMELRVLRPVLADSSFLQLNEGGFLTAARFSEILMFLVFAVFLEQKVSINKTYIKSVGIFVFFFALILLPTLLVLGVDLARNAFNPYFLYTRQVQGYDFIEKVQAFNTLAWFPGVILKLTLYNFMACYILSGIFKTKSHQSFVIPLSIVGFCFCLMPFMNKSDVILHLASDQVFPWIVFPITSVLPLLILSTYLIRRKKINGILEQKKIAAALSQGEHV